MADDVSEEDEGPALPKRRMKSDTVMDMTPMIDCTFLLLIFFVVGAKIDPDTAVRLPPARYGAGVDPSRSVVITIALPPEAKEPQVYLADGSVGEPLPSDPESQAADIRQAVEAVLEGQAPLRPVQTSAP